MKNIIRNSHILLMFFLVFIFKESIYSIFIKTTDLDAINANIREIKEGYYEKEYQELLKTINLKTEDEYKYIFSKVLYRDIYEYYNNITILYGSENNINKNKAVINEDGLIGTITTVNKNSSIVTLITNKESQISVKINNSYGILKYKNNELIVTSINNYENIKAGDIIYTSGLTNLPENIKIGKVKEIITNKLGIEKEISVIPNVDFDNLNYVAILDGDIK